MNRTSAAPLLAVLVVTALLQACGSQSSLVPAGPSRVPEGMSSATPTLQPAAALSPPPPTSAPPGPPEPVKGAAGPYTTLDEAKAFVGSQPAFSRFRPDFINSALIWRPSATLHVVHATPFGMASYGGDYYFFFVDGNVVGQQYFTRARDDSPTDDVTLTITYAAYQSGDAHCCPAGGFHAARFRWTGTSLAVLDPLTGATQQ